MSQKVLVILGTTASGKTSSAVDLARKYDGEIVSADSRQVYRGMDIGTGKDLAEYGEVKHHMIDVADPRDDFSLADYQPQAYAAIEGILSRGKVPIICGGTGLYISALVEGYILDECSLASDKATTIRSELESMSLDQLLAELEQIDPTTYEVIDKQNRRRVQRAVEIYRQTGVPKSQRHQKKRPPYEFLQLGVTFDKVVLDQRIDKRLTQRLEEGMIEEVQQLHGQGVSWQRLYDFGLEYRWVADYLQQKITREEMVTGLSKAIKQFAKRQKTWFKRDESIHWFAIPDEVDRLVKDFLNK